jgi:anionic cell wall polymer biosynthesis LytR-Cps2A-Psr (LCP) family protein
MAKKGLKLGATYLIVFIVTLFLFGFIGMVYIDMLTQTGTEEDDLPSDVSSDGFIPTSADARTILAIVDLGDLQSDVSFMLMRFLPANSETVFLPIPANMYVDDGGTESNLFRLYSDGSATAVKQAISDTFNISVDKYVIFNAESFGKFCDLMGSTDYQIPFEIVNDDGTTIAPGPTFLDRTKMRALLTYQSFSGGEEERARRFSDIITSMLNRELTVSFGTLMDATFTEFINSDIDTDISRLDYEDARPALSYTISHTDRFCRQVFSSGTYSEQGNFIIEPASVNAVLTWFELTSE